MPKWFVTSTATDNTGTGAWDDPFKYLYLTDGSNLGLMLSATPPAAGDTIYILDGHVEEFSSGLITLSSNGTYDATVKFKNVASFNSGTPTTKGADAGCKIGHVSAAVGYDIKIDPNLEIYGFHIVAGDEIFLTGKVFSGSAALRIEDCLLEQLRVGLFDINIGGVSAAEQINTIVNTGFKFASTGRIEVQGGEYRLIDCWDERTSTPNEIFTQGANGIVLHVIGGDFSSGGATELYKIQVDSKSSLIELTDVILPAGVTMSNLPTTATTARLINSGSVIGNGGLWFRTNAGHITDETTNVRTGGAQIDGAGYSLEFNPSGSCSSGNPLVFETQEMPVDFSASKTIDVCIANATRDLTDSEVYVELSYSAYNAAGHKIVDSRSANSNIVGVTITDDTSSTWGGSLTYMQKISITDGGATDGRDGVMRLQIISTTDVGFFVDPLPVIT